MAIRNLKFQSTALWVLEGAKAKVEERKGLSATIKYSGKTSTSGTLKIEGPDKDDVDKAVQSLLDDRFYSQHLEA